MKLAQTITVIGTGYVGMSCAISLSEQGFCVSGYDVDVARIEALQNGTTPYNEDGLETALEAQLVSGRLAFTTNLLSSIHAAQAIIICVNTPTAPNGEADLHDLYKVIEELQSCDLAPTCFVAIRSTVPPGTSNTVARLLQGRAEVVMTPEFLREGHALADTRNPTRSVIGAGSRDAASRYARLLGLAGGPCVLTSRVNAELTKLASNAFLAMKISFANEVANLTEAFEGNAQDVLRGMGMDERIGPSFLQPGIGFGGPCFAKDLKSYRAVAAQRKVAAELVKATLAVNERQPNLVVDKVERELGTLREASIGVWGLTFKAGTDDVRFSLAGDIVTELVRRGARVRAFDPKAAHMRLPQGAERVDSSLEAADADALLVLTEWPEFAEVDSEEVARNLRRKLIIDGRNLLNGPRYAALGVRYFGVGITHLPPPCTQVNEKIVSAPLAASYAV